MINVQDWLSMADTARHCNEEAIWEAHPGQDDQEFHRLRHVLAETDQSAAKAAHLAAWEAYVAAYNEAYEKAHREFYPRWSKAFLTGTNCLPVAGESECSLATQPPD
jgi:hypothetical protein